jgi:hypothetical protein
VKSKGTADARKTTREEFVDNIRLAWALFKQWMPNPRISYDNNLIQKSANLADMGLSVLDKLPLAPYSPDVHKVVEHSFAIAKQTIKNWLWLLSPHTVITPQVAQQLVWSACMQLRSDGMFKDACSLPTTLAVIAATKGQVVVSPVDGSQHVGVGGGWPKASLR